MRVREVAAAARNLDLPGRRVLVAVSGGVDSVVLFHALRRLARRSLLALRVKAPPSGMLSVAGTMPIR